MPINGEGGRILNLRAHFHPSQNDPAHAGEDADLSAPNQAPAIDLVVLLRILRVRREIILGTAAAVITLTLIVLFQLTPLYSASSIVMIDQQKNNVNAGDILSSALSGMPTDQTGIQNQVQILTSRVLAGRVIDKLNLKDDPQFISTKKSWIAYISVLNPLTWLPAGSQTQNDAQHIDSARNGLIDHFLSNLAVAPIGLSTAIKVTYQSPNAAEATRIDNGIADAYVEDQLNAKFDATQKATQWLADRIQELSRQSQAADAAVQQYRAANGLTDTGNGGSIVDEQMSAISGQMVAAKSDLAEKQATYAHVQALVREGRAADISQTLTSPLIATLRTQQTDLIRQEADLSSKYGSRNPKMLQLESQKENLDAKLNEEVQRIVQSVANDVSVAEAHVGSLEASLNRIESQSGQQNQLKVKLAALQSAASSAKSMYEAFLSKLNQTQDQQGIQTPDARIISRAEIPGNPSYPKKAQVIEMAIPAGLVLGLVFALMMERLDAGFRTTYQVEKALGLPVLATIPEVPISGKKATVNAADRVVDKPMSSFAESIRSLHLGLTLSNIDKRPKVIVVTSALPSEGKTTLAVSIARLAAKSGIKTIIVDGDLRRPQVAKIVGIEAPQLGLLEALLHPLRLDECISKDPRSDAVILSCREKPKNPSDILASKAMGDLIATLVRMFDLVVIDSAPVLPVNDTKVLGQWADTVLFAVRWEKTAREAAVNALRALSDAHIVVAGVALTRADMKRFQYYSYGYHDYYYYNKYYAD